MIHSRGGAQSATASTAPAVAYATLSSGGAAITTLAAGEFGNTRSEPIVKEFWYSPRLGLNIITKRFDPRSGSQNFIVNHLSLNEPDPRTFEPPADYRIVRQVVVKQGTP